MGFTPIPDRFFDCQRMINFYPFFCIGMILKDKLISMKSPIKRPLLLLLLCFLVFYLVQSHYGNFCYVTGFLNYHGFSIAGMFQKWLAIILTGLMSICVIELMPEKEYCFSGLGSRTMYAYLLHMSVIFPLSWGLFRPIMNEWYGYIVYVILVPALCLVLFSRYISNILKKYLKI